MSKEELLRILQYTELQDHYSVDARKTIWKSWKRLIVPHHRYDYGEVRYDFRRVHALQYGLGNGWTLGLERLTICNHSIRSVSPIKGLSKLKYVNLSGNRIMDLSPLTSLYLLQELHLDSNNICSFPHVSLDGIIHRRICTS